ncbi:hypothetical protein D3873_10935 [Paenisporosarcina cavernae]|uniref:Uncharacterized protein n=1 Tax=Paenisporosarcina cavernae TaxID=2320858 RepID=A0A385YVW4_9BACL|nr:hypothetical protein D3873_10935 [Paenisporosarcina cavernae]
MLKPDTTSPHTATVVTNDDKNIEAVTAVLQSEFTVPNEEYIRIQQNLDTKIDEMLQELPESNEGINLTEDIPEVAAYQELVEKTYKQYYTANEFEKLMPTNQAFRYHIWTTKKDVHYKMKISDIQVTKSENENTPKNYDFGAQVKYTNNAGKTSLHHIKGMAILSEEGKIGKFTIRDDGGIQEKIYEDTMEQ